MTDVTKIDWMTLAEPNEEWEAAVAQLPQRPDFGGFTEISTLRGYIMQAKRKALQALPPLPNIEIKDHQMPTRDGSEIAVRTYTPIGKTDSPLLVIFHGGGFCIGGLDSEEVLCRRATSELGYVTVNVDYRLAPEHKFPTAVYDCHDATKWAAANASALGADPSKGFVLGGTSAGAGLTLTSTLLTRDERMTPKVTGCHLMIPPLCASTAVPEKYKADYRSWDQNENADILSRKACELFSTNYTRSPEDYSSPMFSPLLWKTGFKDFPATNFQICGADPLRDEGLIFERLLREDEKVKTRVELYPGLPHGFYSVMPTLKVSKKYADDSVAGLKWLQQV